MSVRSRSGGRPAVIGGSSGPGPAAGRGLAPRRAGRGGSGPGRRPPTGRGRRRSPPCSSRRRTAAAARAGGRPAGGRGRAAPRRPRRGSRPAASMSTGSATTRPAPSAVSSEAAGRRRRLATLVGHHVARDPEQPHAERRGVRAVLGRGELAEPGQRGEGAHEHALGRVLRGVVVGELVEGVGIHLGEVLPVQGVESGRIPTGRLDERAVAIERDDASTRRSLPPSKHRTGHRVTPRVRASLHPADLAGVDDAARRPARPRPRPRARPRRRRRPAPGSGAASSSSVTSRPVVAWRSAQSRGRSSPCAARPILELEAVRERPRAAPRGRSAGRRTPRAGWSSTPPGPAGSRARASRR